MIFALTFSMPKNLSLPSPRTGPESSSIFSRGVIGKAWLSFFGDAIVDVGDSGPYIVVLEESVTMLLAE